jgi:fructose 1,6-bisphosphate aldolase/phosphatase
MDITLSVIKADIGGYVGHSESHPDVLAKGEECMAKAKKSGLLIDYHVTKCGDDMELIMTHQHGIDNKRMSKGWGRAWPRCKLRNGSQSQ